MTIVYCDCKECKHSQNDICKRTSIIYDDGAWCMSFEEKTPASVAAEQGA